MQDIPKAYNPADYEDDLYKRWEESGLFNPDVCVEKGVTAPDASPYSIVLPPPNATGTLHIGHAMMLAVEDLLVRIARMQGKKTLWIPGTDHAAIATQNKVEKIIWAEKKLTRHDLGREELLRHVDEFVRGSQATIRTQLRKMGSSLDWSREAFTMDEPRSRAVRMIFKKMYDDGLIYRGNRVVNWCPRCKSTLADDEVEYKPEKTAFYYFKYGPVVIGTARPETKFLDNTIVVHPDDERFKDLVGTEFDVEWILGTVRAHVIADPIVDKEFGTGAMTITPAHSFEDFVLAQKYKLPVTLIIDEEGNLTEAAGSFAGKNARASRQEIVEMLRKKGLVERIDENYEHNLSVCYRCGTAVEPLPKLQWFIDVNKEFAFRQSAHAPIEGLHDDEMVTLKSLMQHVVKTGQTKIVPDRFEKTYFHWIDNLRDWCISRQIWYGHRVPAAFDVRAEENAGGLAVFEFYDFSIPTELKDKIWGLNVGGQEEAGKYYLKHCSFKALSILLEEGIKWNEVLDSISYFDTSKCLKPLIYISADELNNKEYALDEDTLDTWFSSGTWTFSTLGWPNDTVDLRTFHPTSLLETGYDILPFWVARMILMTAYALGEVPFRDVYLHGLVRDEQGRKMSKSLGNVIDPLDVIAKYGTDPVRLSLVLGQTPGNDTKLSEEKISGFRNFTNKLWNIGRYILTQEGEEAATWETRTLADRWIVSRLHEVVRDVSSDVEQYAFARAGEQLRDFTWGELADWYLEASKVAPNPGLLRKILRTVLTLWHPFMPFVTEVLYDMMKREGDAAFLMVAPWPKASEIPHDTDAVREFVFVQQLITSVRSVRQVYRVASSAFINLHVQTQDEAVARLVAEELETIKKLARVAEIIPSDEKPEGSATIALARANIYVPLAEVINVTEERERLGAERDQLQTYIVSVQKKLENEEFVKNAPEAIVEKERVKLAEAQQKLDTILEQLVSLA